MKLWSSQDAARALQLSSRRIRALARAGSIKAHKVGSRWLVEPVSTRQTQAGRPLSSAVAWAILAVITGERPGWIQPSALSRLKRRMRSSGWVLESLKKNNARARTVHWRALPSDISKIMEMPGIVLTALSAVTQEIDLIPTSGEVDAYVTSDVLRKIERQFKPEKESGQPNVTLRVPSQKWILKFKRAPIAVVGADLIQSADPRAARAGQEALRKFLHG